MMKQLHLWVLGTVLGGIAAASCGKLAPDERVGGETHWLRTCSSDAECGGELSCLCGVCSELCSEDASCGELGERARCVEMAESEYATECRSVQSRLCVRSEGPGPDTAPATAMPYDEARGCFDFSAAREVGVLPADLDCPANEVHARRAGTDECWLFPGGCLPDGFERLARTGMPELACELTFSFCSDETPSCSDGEVPIASGCASCDAAREALSDGVTDIVTANGWRACNADADCTTEPWSSPCDGQCNMPLALASVADFRVEIDAIAEPFCPNPEAWRESSCNPRDVDCPIAALCREGLCERVGVPCAGRVLAACESDGNCRLSSGFPFDEANQCFGPGGVNLACVDPDQSCPPVTTAALDSEGNCYMFGDCLPPGFTVAPVGEACAMTAAFCAQ